MKVNKVTKQLYRFLKENKIFVEFLKEFRKQSCKRHEWVQQNSHNFNGTPDYYSLDDFCARAIEKSIIINYSFDWAKTKEGYDFWESLSYDWEREVEQTL